MILTPEEKLTFEALKLEEYHCVRCNHTYLPCKNFQIVCLECEDQFMKDTLHLNENSLTTPCHRCGVNFRKKFHRSAQKICDACHRTRRVKEAERQRKDPKEVFCHPPKRKRPKVGLNFKKMEKKAEYRRLYDEREIKNKIRYGKVRDRI